jgi:hypothetical protein
VTCTSRLAPIAEVALVTLGNSSAVAVRDISNLSKPVTRCLINWGGAPNLLQFRDSTHISYVVQGDGSSSAMYLVDL